MIFETKAKDGLGRIAKLSINGKNVETPCLMPVINPNLPLVTPKEMKKLFKTDIIITNSYILYKSFNVENVHKFLDFDGVIVTDSGSFQLMQYGDIDITNKEIIEYQNKIGVDIATFLDIPTKPRVPYEKAKRDLETTIERGEEARMLREGELNGTIQGSTYLDLRKYASLRMSLYDFDIYPIGAVVPLLMKYNFSQLAEIILTCKKYLPINKPVHLFGAGHPLTFALAVLLGCDLFDSAAYALYANDDRYLTAYGTKNLNEMKYLPCSCPICSQYTLEELKASEEKTKLLALHNLYATYGEIKKIKESIHENSLWNFVESRIRNHPRLYYAYKKIKKYTDFISTIDPFIKKTSLFYTGEETKMRPLVTETKKRLKRVSKKKDMSNPVFKYPKALSFTFPFNIETDRDSDFDSDVESLETIFDYQFGRKTGKKFLKETTVKKSKTNRIRYIYRKDLLATLRARDNLFTLTSEGAKRLHKILKYPHYRVMASEEAVPFILEGRDLLSKFAVSWDTGLRAYEEVLVIDPNDSLLGAGTLMLSPIELEYFERGVAVKMRTAVKL
ncbi:MAG: tRNA guanosine(15) transglycosylase TgtA [Methanomicrobia archaeon]|nr:tRNA guanosine(15) transglycosylase TgtA [Methanomicrobia archaeon]